MLDEAGLESTIDWYIPTIEKQTGIDITYEKSGQPYPVDASAAIHIYRVLQEALNNVARHSGAREAWVRLRFQPDSLQLEIEDHGKGLDASASSDQARHGSRRHARTRRTSLRHHRVAAPPAKWDSSSPASSERKARAAWPIKFPCSS